MGVDENLTLPILTSLSRLGIISLRKRESVARDLRARLSIVSSAGRQLIGELSGGNQQKVVVGRALASKPSVLVIVSPTTGVDVASKAVLLGVIDDARRDGMAVLLVSDDVEELRIATRLMVMVRGRIMREFRERPWNERDAIAAAEEVGGMSQSMVKKAEGKPSAAPGGGTGSRCVAARTHLAARDRGRVVAGRSSTPRS